MKCELHSSNYQQTFIQNDSNLLIELAIIPSYGIAEEVILMS